MTEQTERETLEALWKQLEPEADERGLRPLSVFRDKVRFNILLDAGAYLDAALMLVADEDKGCWAIGYSTDGTAFATIAFDRSVYAATPALALCEAIKAAKDAAP